MPQETRDKPRRAIAAAVQLPSVSDAEFEASLAELRQLAKTLGIEVAGTFTQKRAHFDQSAYFGAGKREELRLAAQDADLVLVVTPSHAFARLVATTSAAAWANTPAFGSGFPIESGTVVTSPMANTEGKRVANVDRSTGIHPDSLTRPDAATACGARCGGTKTRRSYDAVSPFAKLSFLSVTSTETI